MNNPEIANEVRSRLALALDVDDLVDCLLYTSDAADE